MYEYITKDEIREYRGPKMDDTAKTMRERHEDWLMNLSDAEYDEYMKRMHKNGKKGFGL